MFLPFINTRLSPRTPHQPFYRAAPSDPPHDSATDPRCPPADFPPTARGAAPRTDPFRSIFCPQRTYLAEPIHVPSVVPLPPPVPQSPHCAVNRPIQRSPQLIGAAEDLLPSPAAPAPHIFSGVISLEFGTNNTPCNKPPDSWASAACSARAPPPHPAASRRENTPPALSRRPLPANPSATGLAWPRPRGCFLC